MTKTITDVRLAVIDDGAADPSPMGYEDGQQVDAWIDKVSARVISSMSDRVGNTWTLDTSRYFEAVVNEVMSRMYLRILAVYRMEDLDKETIVIGPVQFAPVLNADMVKEMQYKADELHQAAEKLLGLSSSSRGFMKVWIPRERIEIL